MLTRILSAAVMIPAAAACIYYGGLALAAMLLLASLAGLSEFFAMCRAKKLEHMALPAYFATALYYMNVHFTRANDHLRRFEFSPLLVLGAVFIVIWLMVGRRVENAIARASTTVFGFIYISVFLSFGLYIRNLEYGATILFMTVLMIWAADTFAYFGGMRYGRDGKKLVPEVSPKKSVIGVYFGLLGSVAVGIAFIKYFPIPGLPFWAYALFAVVLNAISVTGDLVESQMKRDSGEKDSSHLIPGHGGVLDRIDSTLTVLPVAYYYFVFMLT